MDNACPRSLSLPVRWEWRRCRRRSGDAFPRSIGSGAHGGAGGCDSWSGSCCATERVDIIVAPSGSPACGNIRAVPQLPPVASPGADALRESKRALRERVLAERDRIPPAFRAVASAAIGTSLAARADFSAAKTVLL